MPTVAEALALAFQHHQAGHPAQAEQLYRQVLQADPAHAEAWHLLGVLAHQAGRHDLAVAYILRALALQPQQADLRSNLGCAYQAQGQLDEAEACYREALRLRPDLPEAHNNLGNALQVLGRLEEAEACYRAALRLHPGYPEAHNNLGNALRNQGRLEEAETCFRTALQLRPHYPTAISNLGNALQDMGRLDEALAAYRRAVELDPGSPTLHSNLVYALHFHPGCDAGALAAEARRWAEQHAGPWQQWAAPHRNDADPERRLRVGYVSADLHEHPVATFLEPVLAGLDRCRFHVTCYADVPRPDATTRRLRDLADGWRDLVGRSDEQAAALVRQDGIDLLVDLGGHTAHHRLLLFARKPAPVQVSHFGYPHTTGLRTIDYRLTDRYADPPGTEAYYTEELVRLPEVAWCYGPPPAPDVGPLPAPAAGCVTFGCLNNLAKVTPEAVALWCRLLHAVAGSRLLLLTGAGSQTDQRLARSFERQGIDRGRLELLGRRPRAAYLALYRQIDIGLDPFPYNGGVTTCDALWMGVPVVSLAGNRYASRQGVSILSSLGLHDWIAASPEQYVAIAARAAGDLPALAGLRADLRARMQQSPLVDGERFTRHLGAAYRAMWHRWCARQRAGRQAQ